MIKQISLILICAALTSCGVNYDGESRLVTQITVVDRDGSPIAGRPVDITVADDGDYDVISNSVTDSNGHALLIFPTPDFDDKIQISIYGDGIWQYQYYHNLTRLNFKDYKFVINTNLYRLLEITQLNIKLNHVNLDRHVGDIRIEGLQPRTNVYFQSQPSNLPSYPDEPVSFFVLQEQSITLHYTIYQDSGPQEYTETVQIGTDHLLDYTITY